ncbi:3-hydroxybutyryl-CoA dehydrogenase [Granulosicoccus sp.]|nr:3-hydroxybutyryl-CoA dehydrogenase [Granulosicoccus sp.]MDB4223436.1 3-hydroxybutyryl-CoA dehydrogenase [Granulosicoccus sp.]
MPNREIIASVGAGRMGRGIAITFALAGYEVRLIDLKERASSEFDALSEAASTEIRLTMSMLSGFGMLDEKDIDSTVARVSYFAMPDCKAALSDASIVFEAVPETLDAKEAAFKLVSTFAQDSAIVASTTSTILSDDLQSFVSNPGRFLNAHWLNPAFLIPLVEVSPGRDTDPAVVTSLNALLEKIGKVPVVCSASPGYIVPRIQAIAMNEAARMVEEGVASVEDIDKATKYGFGFRFSILGLLEFIDWGGGDILYYASRYMTKAMDSDRFASPDIIESNMKEGRIGLSTRKGFLDYSSIDVNEYQRAKLAEFVEMLRHIGKLPPNEKADAQDIVKQYLKAIDSGAVNEAQIFLSPDFSLMHPGGESFSSSEKNYERFDQCQSGDESVVYCYGTQNGVRFIDRFTVVDGLIRSQLVWNES